MTERNILWIYTESPSEKLDAATWLETTRGLRALGWNVTLVTAAVVPGRQVVQGVEIWGIVKPNIYLIRQLIFHLQVVSYIIQHWATIDILLFHQMSAIWLLPLKLIRWFSRASLPLFVIDSRTLPMDAESWKARMRGTFTKLMNKIGHKFSDGQTTITTRMAQSLAIPPQQLWGVWSSGVSLEKFALPRKRDWPALAEPIRLIYVGVLNYERNLLSLCQAVERANQQGMNFEFVIVGNGKGRQELVDFAAQTNNRISVLPPVPHEQIPELLWQAHVGVLPFPDQEKFRVSSPIKLFEYMAAGLPVLATRIVCHTDVIEDGDFVFWAESSDVNGLYDALADCWQLRSTFATKSHSAIANAQNWTWQMAATRLSRALELGLFNARRLRTGSEKVDLVQP